MDPAQQKADAKQRELADVRAKREVKVLKRDAAFTEHSIQKTLERIRTDRLDEQVVEWARLEMAKAGHPLGKKARAAALLKAWREQFGYTEDPFDAEFIAKARDVMCLPGHDYCLMGGECEEAISSLLSEMSCVGLQVALLLVTFRPGTPQEQKHVMGAVLAEDGWIRFDPSYFNELGSVITVDKHGKGIPRRERWIDVMTGTDLHRGDGSTTPKDGVSSAVMLAARPNLEYVGISGVSLGDADVPEGEAMVLRAWADTTLRSSDQEMVAAFESAKSSIAALHDTRDALAKANPAIQQYDPEGSGGWTATLAKGFHDKLATAVDDLHRYATDVLAGARGVAWASDDTGGELVIAGAPTDKHAYSLGPAGSLLITDVPATQPPPPDPGLGVAPAIVVLGVAASAAVYGVAVYLTVSKLCETYQSHVAAIAQRDLAKATSDMIKNGATPAEAKAIVDAIGKATVPPPSTASGDLLAFGKTIMTGLIVVAGVGAVLFVADKAFKLYEESRGAKRIAAA